MKIPCPLMSAETDRGITFSSLATAPLPPIRLAVGAVGAVRAVGVRVVVSVSVVSACIIPKPSLCPKPWCFLGRWECFPRLQKVMWKPEIPLQSAETTAFRGTSGGRLARLVASETRYLPETRCFRGNLGWFLRRCGSWGTCISSLVPLNSSL